MGITQSSDNDELVDVLVNEHRLRCKHIERALRLVDRGRFFPEAYRGEAYRDNPWKAPEGSPGKVHISAPAMYITVLEALNLKSGHTFLNIGSGTGWLNTVVGFLIGSTGVNHGIEVHDNIVEYSRDRLEETLRRPEICAYDWCEPIFAHGNALSEEPATSGRLYDRIYCGAAVSATDVPRLIKFLTIDGIMVAPIQSTFQLMLYKRTGDESFETHFVSSVQFADLVEASGEPTHVLPSLSTPSSLQHHCRLLIRNSIRHHVHKHHTIEMRTLVPEFDSDDEAPRERERINVIVPLPDEEGGNRIVFVNRERGGGGVGVLRDEFGDERQVEVRMLGANGGRIIHFRQNRPRRVPIEAPMFADEGDPNPEEAVRELLAAAEAAIDVADEARVAANIPARLEAEPGENAAARGGRQMLNAILAEHAQEEERHRQHGEAVRAEVRALAARRERDEPMRQRGRQLLNAILDENAQADRLGLDLMNEYEANEQHRNRQREEAEEAAREAIALVNAHREAEPILDGEEQEGSTVEQRREAGQKRSAADEAADNANKRRKLERDRQLASLLRSGEAFRDALASLPISKHAKSFVRFGVPEDCQYN